MLSTDLSEGQFDVVGAPSCGNRHVAVDASLTLVAKKLGWLDSPGSALECKRNASEGLHLPDRVASDTKKLEVGAIFGCAMKRSTVDAGKIDDSVQFLQLCRPDDTGVGDLFQAVDESGILTHGVETEGARRRARPTDDDDGRRSRGTVCFVISTKITASSEYHLRSTLWRRCAGTGGRLGPDVASSERPHE